MITLTSHGFKYGRPDANIVFDVSYFNNPWRQQDVNASRGYDDITDAILTTIRAYDKNYPDEDVVVAVCCSAGEYRSPMVVESLSKTLTDEHIRHRVVHGKKPPIRFHVVVGYKRQHLKEKMLRHFTRHNVILHPISYFPEVFTESWVRPFVVNETPGWTQCYDKFNQWITAGDIIDEDYYIFISDDDGFEPDFFTKLHGGSVIVTSAKRGHRVPPNGKPYPTTPLIADRCNMRRGHVDLMQLCVRGSTVREMRWQNSELADGMMAEWLSSRDVTYLPEAFGYFNLLQEGRWDDSVVNACC